MKNVILPTEEYTFCREWLRGQPIKWRDMSSSMAVPNWGDCITDKTFSIDGRSCAQIAYEILKEYYPGLSLKWRKEELELLALRAPLLYSGPYVGQCFYLDIKSAYWQFYSYLYLHSDYPYKRQRYPLWSLSREFVGRYSPEWKIARNALTGICRSTHNKWVCQDKVWKTRKVNPYLSPTLWGQLMGLFNQIAFDMQRIGAIWFNTDGFIFSSEEAYTKALNYFEEREIVIGEKGIGIGSISGINCIDIPGVKTTKNRQGSKEVYHLEATEIDHYHYWNLNRKAILQ